MKNKATTTIKNDKMSLIQYIYLKKKDKDFVEFKKKINHRTFCRLFDKNTKTRPCTIKLLADFLWIDEWLCERLILNWKK